MTDDSMDLRGTAPGGATFHAVISPKIITLRVGDRTCIGAPGWLTDVQRHKLIDALVALDD